MSTSPTLSTVDLDEPIKRGEKLIKSVDLRKPGAGELRGVAVIDIVRGDVDALIKVVPRISNPPLTERDVASLDPADLLDMSTTVSRFFLKKADREELSPPASKTPSQTLQ